MNFDFSDEQKQLKDSARKFLEKESTPQQVRAVLEGDAGYDKALWKGLAEMGFTGAAIPEEHGGAGLGYLELCVIAEELGRAVARELLDLGARELMTSRGDDAPEQGTADV